MHYTKYAAVKLFRVQMFLACPVRAIVWTTAGALLDEALEKTAGHLDIFPEMLAVCECIYVHIFAYLYPTASPFSGKK